MFKVGDRVRRKGSATGLTFKVDYIYEHGTGHGDISAICEAERPWPAIFYSYELELVPAPVPTEHFCKGGCGKSVRLPSAICAECIGAVTTRVRSQLPPPPLPSMTMEYPRIPVAEPPSPYDAERNRLADECGRLRDQVRDLEAENGRLRRQVERLERARGRR